MQAPAREADEFYGDEQPQHRALWFWIVPVLVLLTCGAAVVTHNRPNPARTSHTAAAGSLPELGMIQFDAGKATLTPDGLAALDRAADAMHGNPNVRLRLEGYETARVRHKKKEARIDPIALQRAQAVETYLEARGIERSRLSGGKFLQRAREQAAAFPDRGVESRRAELYAQ